MTPADKAAALEAEVKRSNWKTLMQQGVFRRWLWEHAGTELAMDLKSPLMREARAACPLEFVEMCRENLQRENNDAALGEAVPKSGER